VKAHLTNLIKAGYGCAYCITHEEQRVFGELLTVAKSLDYDVWQWSITAGLESPSGKKQDKTQDPLAVLTKFMEVTHRDEGPEGNIIKNKSLLVLKDYHAFLRGNPPPLLTRALKEAIGMARSTNRPIVIIGCALHLPPELEKEVMPVEFSLPSREDLKVVAVEIAESAKQELNGNADAILDAAAGLTTTEFADAAAYSVAEKKEIEPGIINRIKADTIKKGGILEVINPGVTFDDLGGLQELKNWIVKRKGAFTKKAREYGLPLLKGVILCGVQGAGKSYATRAIASELDCPLLRLDAGKLFGGLVGSSEANVRAVIAQVEAFGKCCLQIDEIDKGFAGMTGGHDGDSGTTRRVIGTFLTWMQDKTSPVFIIATANDLTKLPPELLRKGRWDELFFIDLPTVDERVEIWRVQIRKHGRKPEEYDLKTLAQRTENWTGAEIEALFKESLFAAFEHDREPSTTLIEELSFDTMPLSKTMAEPIKALRDWSVGRARSASAPVETKTVSMKRKIA